MCAVYTMCFFSFNSQAKSQNCIHNTLKLLSEYLHVSMWNTVLEVQATRKPSASNRDRKNEQNQGTYLNVHFIIWLVVLDACDCLLLAAAAAAARHRRRRVSISLIRNVYLLLKYLHIPCAWFIINGIVLYPDPILCFRLNNIKSVCSYDGYVQQEK